MSQVPEFSDIRNPLDEQKLADYLDKMSSSLGSSNSQLPRFCKPYEIKQFTFGQSNPTYLVTDSLGAKYVLRRKPMPNSKLVSKSAHAIEREFFMLKGIAECNKSVEKSRRVPVPEVFFLCEDESVLGVVFYMMEYVEGRSIKQPDMREISKSQHMEYWESIMRSIAAIHSVDCSKLIKFLPAKHFPQFQPERLENRQNSPSYFERQIKTLAAVQASQAKTVDEIPGFGQLIKWVSEHSPKDPDRLTLVHGDCKIDNFLFHKEKPEVIAVLDWELCTMGHPIFDLANFLQPYMFPKSLNRAISPGATIGIENPASASHVEQVLQLYESILGHKWRVGDATNNPRDLWKLGSVFGLLRLCVISQGVAMRVKKGSASSASATAIAGLYKNLSPLALDLIKKGQKL
ncbi:hypothetical protein OXX80_005103 [Metschnikowia pulcherrima]